ncbi:hypothetical protein YASMINEVIRUS_1380 [Yasminevirus sp. GU-2018]|uniref:Uncharacterized protein n=1 Tax=Yasminevirus sp. GU-2018 TaxID=2420051 RepID=A0A5K0UA00_9VIRU|nr:hypothetical protein YASMINEVIRUS_1380 [Yasminevirus sp. GU-2018]
MATASVSSKKVRDSMRETSSDVREQAKNLARDLSKEISQNITENTNGFDVQDQNQDQGTVVSSKKTEDHIKYAFEVVLRTIKSVYFILLPIVMNAYSSYFVNSKTGSKNESKSEGKRSKKTETSVSSLPASLKNLDINLVKNNVGYLFLAFEVYSILFHNFLVRVWILANFVATVLYMYNTLSDPDIKKRFVPIGTPEVKKYSGAVVVLGAMLLLFFTTSVGMFTIPLILYLLNRTTKNVFGRGF